jgi:5-(carboxyamino)imidazole ribonucleotide synthase
VTSMPKVFGPGSRLGIVGGGQLARMIALSAAELGIASHIFTPEPHSPGGDVAAQITLADYDDETALSTFAQSVDLITYEFENVPARTAAFLADRRPLHPNAEALATTQDRLLEKEFISSLHLPVASFHAVETRDDLARGVQKLGPSCILKTRRFGYDGKGQVKITAEDSLTRAFDELGGVPAVLESFVPFAREISVVAARTAQGQFCAFDICENTHRDHILQFTHVPADIQDKTAEMAISATKNIADALQYVGVIAVEMFITSGASEENIIINEIAPRVHNSAHWTIDGANTSQFQQHVRAICGLPLGSVTRRGTIQMENIVGDAAERWLDFLADPNSHLHLYGKRESRPGRKMGHVTRVL